MNSARSLLAIMPLSAVACTTVIGLPDLPQRSDTTTESNQGGTTSSSGQGQTPGGTLTGSGARNTSGTGGLSGGTAGSADGPGENLGGAGGEAGETGVAACTPPCTGGTTCQQGECRCPLGEILCDDACVPSDVKNCGACGKTCSESCSSGRCVTTLPTLETEGLGGNIDRAAALVVAGNTIYFTTSTGDFVCSARRDGSMVQVLASSQINATGLTFDANNIYWANAGNIAGGGKIMKMSRAGGQPVELATEAGSPTVLAIDGSFVYWAGEDVPLKKVAIGGGVVTTLSSEPTAQTATNLIADGTTLFWSNRLNSGTILKLDVSGTSVLSLGGGISGVGNYKSLAKSDDHLYFLHLPAGHPPELAKTPTSSSNVTPIAEVTGFELEVDDDAAYVANGGGIVRVSLDGSSVVQLIAGSASALFLDTNDLFWRGGDGTFRVTPKAP